MSRARTILVTGATGKQGGSVIDALTSLQPQQTSPFKILALVRDPTSSGAQKLAKLPNVSLVQGDLNQPGNIFTNYYAQQNVEPIWGLYSVQINSKDELTQGRNLIDAAKAHNIRHIVYSSGDRGGPVKSARDPTNVENFANKFAIERHLENAAASSTKDDAAEITFTILRPVTFFENQTIAIHGKGFMRMFMQMQNGHKKLQMISTRDIGWFAAQSFANSESPVYKNAALSLAGDELTAREAAAIYKEVTGKDMPMALGLVGKAVKTFRPEVGSMFAWFEAEGYGADVEACRIANPNMADYRTWLKQCSGFV